MKTTPLLPAVLAIAVAQCLAADAHAQTPPQDDSDKPVTLEQVDVRAQAIEDRWPKLQHIMREVDGPLITVTKKTSITKLDNIPTVVDNNLRNLFAQTPGLLLSEQQAPGQLNLNYRGIGNPQESEFVTVLLDGIPLEGDWVGFPTVYTFPLPQSLAEVQLIRGGSSLLYGPEPPPTVNLVSRKPVADRAVRRLHRERRRQQRAVRARSTRCRARPAAGITSSTPITGTATASATTAIPTCPGCDLHLGYRADDTSYTALDLHSYDLDTGDAGKLSYPQFVADEDQATTPFNRLWTHRHVLSLSHEQQFDDRRTADRQSLDRLPGPGVAFAGSRRPRRRPSTLQDEQFRFSGLDARVVHRWGRGNAFTIGTTLYDSDAPFRQWTEAGLAPDRDDRFGAPASIPPTWPAHACARRARRDYARGVRRERVPLRQRLACRAVGAHRP